MGAALIGAARRVVLLLLVALLVWAVILWRGPGPLDAPADRHPGDLAAEGVLRIVVLGTSLSSPARYDWTEAVAEPLEQCLNRPVEMIPVARAGATVAWGRTQVETALAADPALVLVEFSANDADLLDGLGRGTALAETVALVAELSAGGPRVALMTMNPASGLRGVLRPVLAGHYADYRRLATAGELGLIDLEARWRAMPRAERGLDDGLHPAPDVARAVIVGGVTDALCP